MIFLLSEDDKRKEEEEDEEGEGEAGCNLPLPLPAATRRRQRRESKSALCERACDGTYARSNCKRPREKGGWPHTGIGLLFAFYFPSFFLSSHSFLSLACVLVLHFHIVREKIEVLMPAQRY